MAIKLNVDVAPFTPSLDDDDADERRQRLLRNSLGEASENKKSAVKPTVEGASKGPSKGASQSASKAPVKEEAKAASQAQSAGASKAASQPQSAGASKAASQAQSEGASKAASKAQSAEASEAASKAQSAGASKAASLPTAEPALEAPVQAAAEPASEAPVQAAAGSALKAPVQAAAEPASKALLQAAAEPASEAPVQAAAEPASKDPVKAAAKPASKDPVQAAAEPAVKAASKKSDNYRIEKNKSLFLSPTLRYTRAKDIHINVLNEIAKLCILAGRLSTEMESYEFIASRLNINGHTLRGIVRKLENEHMLILRDEHYVSGSRGRVFEIAPQTLYCLLHNDKSLKSWLARNAITLENAKNLFDFQ